MADAYIEVKRLGRFNYTATVISRPDTDGDSLFPMLLMELGPFYGRKHQSAWRKAWKAAGRPNIVELDEL